MENKQNDKNIDWSACLGIADLPEDFTVGGSLFLDGFEMFSFFDLKTFQDEYRISQQIIETEGGHVFR